MKEKDRQVLRGLAQGVAEVASDTGRHRETAEKWRRLNDMEPVRPMVYIFQIPWYEMDSDPELQLRTTDERSRAMEEKFRRILYKWEHMPGDMVVEPFYVVSECVIAKETFGLEVQRERIESDGGRGVPSSHYVAQINDESDIEKIKDPSLSCDYKAAEEEYEWSCEVLEGILDVKRQGPVHFHFAPWDRLAMLCEPGKILLDLAMRPDFIHKLIGRLVDSYCSLLDQMEERNLLSIGNGSYVIGTGGLGHTGDLPQPDCNPSHVRLKDQWGSGMAQIFSEVSPAMHEEFALQYEKKYLNRAGLVYYGCCEPLHRKVDIVARNITNLRKISMSPWADHRMGCEAIDGRFVFSFKANPAFLATEGNWAMESARRQIQEVLDITGGRHLEIILKDISTVKHEPGRIWEWAEMVSEMVSRYE